MPSADGVRRWVRLLRPQNPPWWRFLEPQSLPRAMRRPPRDAPSRGDWALGKLIKKAEPYSRSREPQSVPGIMSSRHSHSPSGGVKRRGRPIQGLIRVGARTDITKAFKCCYTRPWRAAAIVSRVTSQRSSPQGMGMRMGCSTPASR